MCELGPEPHLPSVPEAKREIFSPAIGLLPRLVGQFRLHGTGTGENFRVPGRTAAVIPTPSRDLSLRTDWCRWVISAWSMWSFRLKIHHFASSGFSGLQDSEYFPLLRTFTIPRVKRGPGVTHKDPPARRGR